MYEYEIPITESAYSARSKYLKDKKQEQEKEKIQKEYADFISNSRDYLISEAINKVLQDSLDESVTEEDRKYGKALVEGFVKEQTSNKLLREFSHKSLFLSAISEAVESTHQKIIHSNANMDGKKPYRITKTINDEFFTKLIGLEDPTITNKINSRVCDAMEDFVQANVNDKLDLEELAEKTKDKIDNIKARNTEEKKKIEESYTMQYKREVQQIKNISNRKVGLYEQLMHKMTQNIISDSTILESFTLESGKINIPKIEGKVNVLYTFLEMLNTTNMININESYIEDILRDMK